VARVVGVGRNMVEIHFVKYGGNTLRYASWNRFSEILLEYASWNTVEI